MKRPRVVVMVLGAVLALGLAGCAGDEGGTGGGGGTENLPKMPAGSTMEKIQQKGKLVVGTKFDQPLFGLQNPVTNKVEGFDVDIAKQIAKEIFGTDDESRMQFVETVSKNREPFLQEGKVDIVVATYTINDERKQKVGFAGPYYVAGQDIMVKKDDNSIKGVEDLNGKKVCTVQGSTSEKNLKAKAPQAQVTLLDTYSKCAEYLGDGRVQAVTTDNVILSGLIQQSNNAYKLVGNRFSQEPYGIGVKKEATDLRNFINDTLEKMYQDGRWKKAYEDNVAKIDPKVPEPPKVDRYQA